MFIHTFCLYMGGVERVNYTEFAYQFLSLIIVSPLSSHNISPGQLYLSLQKEQEKENTIESQGGVQLRM